jgi:calcineurin-like phosphoesterase
VLPGGTAYLTDAGMTGPHDSVIGVRADVILARFTTGLPSRFEPAEDDVRIEGAVIECGSDGRATSIETFRLRESES